MWAAHIETDWLSGNCTPSIAPNSVSNGRSNCLATTFSGARCGIARCVSKGAQWYLPANQELTAVANKGIIPSLVGARTGARIFSSTMGTTYWGAWFQSSNSMNPNSSLECGAGGASCEGVICVWRP